MVKNYYSAQALAIVMCLLVITMTITFFVVATNHNNSNVLGESEDNESKTLLETLTSQFTTLDNTTLFRSVASQNGYLRLNNLKEIEKYIEPQNENFNTRLYTEYCSENNLKVNASMELTSDYYMEINKGKVLSYNIASSSITNDSPCTLSLLFESRGSSSTRFAVQKIYQNSSEENFTYYCISDDGNCVFTDNGMDWKNISVRDTINLSLLDRQYGNSLSSIRVIALDGDMAIKSSLSTLGCAGTFDTRFVYLKTYLSCKSASNSMDLYIPYKKYQSYTAITDYSEYKALGFLNY